MGKRGAQPFEEKLGVQHFKELVKRLTVQDISALFCEHWTTETEKRKCKACIRSIYRAKKRVQRKERQDKRYEPIAKFEDIPEIRAFIQYEQAKGKKNIKPLVSSLRRYWNWVKENPELEQLQRPALWSEKHIVYVLNKLKELHIALYAPKQALRRFFESKGDMKMLKHPLLRASRKDMRSPNGAKRTKTHFDPQTLERIFKDLTEWEKVIVQLHLTVKSREGDIGKGSLLGAQWKDIDWKDTFYGFPTATISIFEPKTKGGTYWRHIPLNLWFADLSEKLRAYCEVCNPEDSIANMSYEQYRSLWHRISKSTGLKLQPHDCRRSAASWLRDLGLSDLALGQYNPTTGEAIGYMGVGWENAEIFFQRYGKRNPQTIFGNKPKLDTDIFNGLVIQILEKK